MLIARPRRDNPPELLKTARRHSFDLIELIFGNVVHTSLKIGRTRLAHAQLSFNILLNFLANKAERFRIRDERKSASVQISDDDVGEVRSHFASWLEGSARAPA